MSDWSLVYNRYEPAQEGLREALCALGNGYFVTRGAAPDCANDGVHYPGTYLAGGYNRLITNVAGRDVENEDLVNLPNWLPLSIRIADGDWLTPDKVEILSYRQELDVEGGVLLRTIRFRDAAGRTTRWAERRFVSMDDQHLAGLAVTITAEDWSDQVAVRSALDGSVINDNVRRYRELNRRHLETVRVEERDGHVMLLQSRFNSVRLEVALAARTTLYLNGEAVEPARRTDRPADVIAQEIALELSAGDELLIEKVVALCTSRDHAIYEAGHSACYLVARARRFDDLLAAHRRAWAHLWEECSIGIDALQDGDVLMKLRVHMFHILQTVSYHTIDLDVGVPARGWHGEAYRGHIFWDELFIFPFLNLRVPILTRALLRYRYRRLAQARAAARAEGYEGAMYPWQSGSTGREETQVVHLNPKSGRWLPDASRVQRHINAAVAYNVWHYYQVTDDYEFLYFYGAEMLLEIARFWASISTYNPATDRYEIRGVMGPDEFHTGYPDREEPGLDNNAYTNVMAAWVLTRALDVLDLLPDARRRELLETLGISDGDLERWDEVSRKLMVPMDEDGIIQQFEGYRDLKELDWQGLRKRHNDIQRLDRVLEAEGDDPNCYKASKQADVLMLFYLFSADELTQIFEQLGYNFESDTIPKNIEYYMARTSHGSTLSYMVHSWVLARSDRRRSWEMFTQTLNADIGDVQGGTTAEGIHLGAMAGSVDIIQRCYVGLEPRTNVLHFNPSLPEQLGRLTMRIRYRRQILDVEVDDDRLKITSRQFTAGRITVAYRGHFREMSPGDSYTFRLIKPSQPAKAARPSPRQIFQESAAE